MECYAETRGRGPDLVLLHGWGLHGGVFDALADRLADHYCVHAVDLPGHGASGAVGVFDAAAVADALAAQFPLPVHVLGWSLGGLVAQHWAARHPSRVLSLALVSTSPRFVSGPDWPHAQDAAAMRAVADALGGQFERTLENFLSLQTLGAPHARELARALSASLFAHGRPQGLLPALECLLSDDARPLARDILAPTLVLGGERDRITPPGASRWLAEHLPHGTLHMFGQASHLPFVSHAAAFEACLRQHLDHHA
ncbi:pimeloyl-ACP methyl ester esterase BioH [Crenobacter intestini]|uniref:Pimeloyl-[acyl-carrier protein] methyl ester esterase n=1 Tax=Crenobacter intestini TaxID=2563443 RepID=A0A4T0V3X4_9NEIS|nr:pimeloyl-ACP methyl ester esterase BioH [Crenobacter intestini]TIC86041.1 pimeloyl-ACP methyl ester esterase BioH [Crenobacter intestini]